MAMRAAARLSSRRMSSLAVAGQAASVQLNQEGLAELPKTLPIHKRGEDQLVREGAQARMASGGSDPPPIEIVEITDPPSHASTPPPPPFRPSHPPHPRLPNAAGRLPPAAAVRGHR